MMEKISEVFEYNTEALHVSLVKVWSRYHWICTIFSTKTTRLLGSFRNYIRVQKRLLMLTSTIPTWFWKMSITRTSMQWGVSWIWRNIATISSKTCTTRRQVFKFQSRSTKDVRTFVFFLLVHILTFILFPYSW